MFTIAENLQKDSSLSQINFVNFVYCVKAQAKKATQFEKKSQLVSTLLSKCQNQVGYFFSNYVVFSDNLNFKAQAKAVKSQAEAEKLQVIVHSSSLDCFHIHQDH